MFVLGEGNGPEGVSTPLDAGELNHDGHDQDHKEERVVEEVREYVDFCRFQFTGVDFVEDL